MLKKLQQVSTLPFLYSYICSWWSVRLFSLSSSLWTPLLLVCSVAGKRSAGREGAAARHGSDQKRVQHARPQHHAQRLHHAQREQAEEAAGWRQDRTGKEHLRREKRVWIVRNKSSIFCFKDAFDEVVKFFGENSKTTPPSVFFPVFVRFVKAYRVSTQKVRKTHLKNSY